MEAAGPGTDAGRSRLCPTRRSLEARLELAVLGRVTPRGRGLPSTQAPRTRERGLPGRGPSAGLFPRLAPSCLARCPSPQQAPPPSFVCIPGACVSLGSRHVYAGSLAQSCWRAPGSRPPGLGATVSMQSSLSRPVTHTSSRIPGNAFLLLSLMLFSCLMRTSPQASMATAGWGGRGRKWTNPFPRRAPQIPISHALTPSHTHLYA